MPRKATSDIKAYWNQEAETKGSDPRATTPDYWFRELEIKKITEALKNIEKKNQILDIGCGNGWSTMKLVEEFPRQKFIGGDYAEKMIERAGRSLRNARLKTRNVDFRLMDVLDLRNFKNDFDVVISDRCLINLPGRRQQKKAIGEITRALKKGGHYIMVENFMEGHSGMNKLRQRIGLKEIAVRWHNLYFDNEFIEKVVMEKFKLLKEENISSIYWLLTRVVYAKLCQLEKREPDYDHPIYKIATDIGESTGDYGPIKLMVLKKN